MDVKKDVVWPPRCPTSSSSGWAHAPAIHTTGQVAHEKRVAWVPISMHACDPVPIVIVLRYYLYRKPYSFEFNL